MLYELHYSSGAAAGIIGGMLGVLDLVGVFAFAFYGAMRGLKSGFNIFGILACGFIVAFAGGTAREIILNNQPAYLHDYTYLYVAVSGACCAVFTRRFYRRLHPLMITADAIGLAAFAFIGAYRADTAGMGILAMCMFAVMTAAGGGIACDIVTGKTPVVFKRGFYIAPALLLAIGYFALQGHMSPGVTGALITGTIALRLSVLSRKRLTRTWRPLLRRNAAAPPVTVSHLP